MNITFPDRIVREQQAAYAAVGAGQDHALVLELWAIGGQSDPFHVQPGRRFILYGGEEVTKYNAQRLFHFLV